MGSRGERLGIGPRADQIALPHQCLNGLRRRIILFELGELLERQMSQVDQGMAYYKRSLEVDPLYLPALEAAYRVGNAVVSNIVTNWDRYQDHIPGFQPKEKP